MSAALSSKNPRSRGWCFTLNNYTDEHLSNVDSVECQYIIYGREVGESGTPHLQGYIHFPNARFLSSLRKLIPGAHLTPANGSPEQNIAYCSKEGNVTERGTRPLGAVGKKVSTKEKIENDPRLLDPSFSLDHLVSSGVIKPYSISSIKKARQIIFEERAAAQAASSLLPWPKSLPLQEDQDSPFPYKDLESCVNGNAIVAWLNKVKQGTLGYDRRLWIHGSTGLGKTRLVDWIRQFFRVYVFSGGDFFQGLSSDHELIVIDEFTDSFMPYTLLNTLVDNRPDFHYNQKGGGIIMPTLPVIVISNYSISECYVPDPERNKRGISPEIRSTLLRRFYEINQRQVGWHFFPEGYVNPPISQKEGLQNLLLPLFSSNSSSSPSLEPSSPSVSSSSSPSLSDDIFLGISPIVPVDDTNPIFTKNGRVSKRKRKTPDVPHTVNSSRDYSHGFQPDIFSSSSSSLVGLSYQPKLLCGECEFSCSTSDQLDHHLLSHEF